MTKALWRSDITQMALWRSDITPMALWRSDITQPGIASGGATPHPCTNAILPGQAPSQQAIALEGVTPRSAYSALPVSIKALSRRYCSPITLSTAGANWSRPASAPPDTR